jgi:hypothetical protein
MHDKEQAKNMSHVGLIAVQGLLLGMRVSNRKRQSLAVAVRDVVLDALAKNMAGQSTHCNQCRV